MYTCISMYIHLTLWGSLRLIFFIFSLRRRVLGKLQDVSDDLKINGPNSLWVLDRPMRTVAVFHHLAGDDEDSRCDFRCRMRVVKRKTSQLAIAKGKE